MAYYGLLEDEIAEMYAFLKLALRAASADLPFRGPEKFQAKDRIFKLRLTGDISYFTDLEEIRISGRLVFFQDIMEMPVI